MPPFIPYGRQAIGDDDIAAVLAVLHSDFLTQGPAVPRFEAALATYVGARHAVACASGTAGLHLASLALALGPGDAVVVPAITFAATANAVLYTGATPVFADLDEALCLSAESAAEALALAKRSGLKPRALYAVHYAGRPADLKGLADLAEREGLVLVEDACHALGAQSRPDEGSAWRHVGHGQPAGMAIWSFHPVKHVTTGEGGAVTTDDDALAKRLQLLRSHGITKDPADFVQPDLAFDPASGLANPWYYEMQLLGYNYRLSDIQAALGITQLAKLDASVQNRRRLADFYRETLADLPATTLPPGDSPTARHSYHLFPLRLDFARLKQSRQAVMTALSARHVGTQVHYLPIPWLLFYRAHPHRWLSVPTPHAEAFYAQALSIPMYATVSDTDRDRVAAALTDVLSGAVRT